MSPRGHRSGILGAARTASSGRATLMACSFASSTRRRNTRAGGEAMHASQPADLRLMRVFGASFRSFGRRFGRATEMTPKGDFPFRLEKPFERDASDGYTRSMCRMPTTEPRAASETSRGPFAWKSLLGLLRVLSRPPRALLRVREGAAADELPSQRPDTRASLPGVPRHARDPHGTLLRVSANNAADASSSRRRLEGARLRGVPEKAHDPHGALLHLRRDQALAPRPSQESRRGTSLRRVPLPDDLGRGDLCEM